MDRQAADGLSQIPGDTAEILAFQGKRTSQHSQFGKGNVVTKSNHKEKTAQRSNRLTATTKIRTVEKRTWRIVSTHRQEPETEAPTDEERSLNTKSSTGKSRHKSAGNRELSRQSHLIHRQNKYYISVYTPFCSVMFFRHEVCPCALSKAHATPLRYMNQASRCRTKNRPQAAAVNLSRPWD
jgi:hypothetical protein